MMKSDPDLLRSLSYRDPDRLAIPSYSRWPGTVNFATGAEFLEWRDQANVFEQIAAYRSDFADLKGIDEPERLTEGRISAGLFATLGVNPVIGRDFTLTEDTPSGPPAVILSDGLWRRRFGSDPQVIG